MYDSVVIPCPFCGAASETNDRLVYIEYDGDRRYVRCDGCGASGPRAYKWDVAWSLWDSRCCELKNG